MTHITCRLTAKNWDQLRNPTLCNRVWATFNLNSCELQCEQPNWNPYVQNWLSTNRPSFAAANQVVILHQWTYYVTGSTCCRLLQLCNSCTLLYCIALIFIPWELSTHTRLTALCPGLPGWAGTRKVKPIWILLEQEIVSGSGISWACASLHLAPDR